MSNEIEFADKLTEVQSIYDEVGELRSLRAELASVPTALEEYARMLSDEDSAVDAATERRMQLAAEKARLQRGLEDNRYTPRDPPSSRASPLGRAQLRPTTGASERDAAETDREAALASRRRLKRVVNRWAYAWGLDDQLRGEINRVADDAGAPLGQAIAMLDWQVFARPLSTRETVEAHLTRLREWGDALANYRTQLRGEVEVLRTRFASSVPLWERWCERTKSAEAALRWEALIDDARRSRREDLDRLERETAVLAREVSTLRQSG